MFFLFSQDSACDHKLFGRLSTVTRTSPANSNIVDGFVFEADGCKVSIQVASGLRVLHAKVKGFLCIAHGCSFAETSTLFCTLPRVFTYLR